MENYVGSKTVNGANHEGDEQLLLAFKEHDRLSRGILWPPIQGLGLRLRVQGFRGNARKWP